jgi:hypothetical protein
MSNKKKMMRDVKLQATGRESSGGKAEFQD